jgi:hypothetical protein
MFRHDTVENNIYDFIFIEIINSLISRLHTEPHLPSYNDPLIIDIKTKASLFHHFYVVR